MICMKTKEKMHCFAPKREMEWEKGTEQMGGRLWAEKQPLLQLRHQLPLKQLELWVLRVSGLEGVKIDGVSDWTSVWE